MMARFAIFMSEMHSSRFVLHPVLYACSSSSIKVDGDMLLFTTTSPNTEAYRAYCFSFVPNMACKMALPSSTSVVFCIRRLYSSRKWLKSL